MTEDDARDWLLDHVPRETFVMLERLCALVIDEADRQNLVAASTIPHILARHVVDSAQLLEHAPSGGGSWLDLGSGAGFPGLVIAIITQHRLILAEARRRRVEFLRHAVEQLDLSDRVEVHAGRVEQMRHGPFDIITARAFAPVDRLLATAHHLSSRDTVWLLPKGKAVAAELDAARRSWQGDFRRMPSITDPDAAIVVATRVRARAENSGASEAR